MAGSNERPNVIAIGTGPSGIALAYAMKVGLGFDNFMMFDQLDGAGGTWRANNYPGCGCDVSTQLYSYSFNLNPDWPQDLCDQGQILQYLEDTIDTFNLRPHMYFNVDCLGAEWLMDQKRWKIYFLNHKTNTKFVRYATVFISCVGNLSLPKDVPFEGKDSFKGESFHSARWNHNYDITGKRMAIIGNGCSAVQLLPNVKDEVAFVQQYARSAQWYHKRPNRTFTWFEKFCFKYIPFYQRLNRLSIFLEGDRIVDTYVGTEKAAKLRASVEKEATEYILKHTPKKYHSFIVPDFPLGCKRRIFDGGYLDSLHAPNVKLLNEGILRITEKGIVSASGKEDEFDVIVYATGFRLADFLQPMEIIGAEGVSLHQQWRENGGVQAYLGTFVHNFPNFAITIGPNTVPSHGSAIFAAETYTNYIANTLVAPIIDGRVQVLDVKEAAENEYFDTVQKGLQGAVFSAGCHNWYFDEFGRNAAHWHGKARTMWYNTLVPQGRNFWKDGGSLWGYVSTFKRWLRTSGTKTWCALLVVVLAGALRNRWTLTSLQALLEAHSLKPRASLERYGVS